MSEMFATRGKVLLPEECSDQKKPPLKRDCDLHSSIYNLSAEAIREISMDYLFYGTVTVTRQTGMTTSTIALDIECEPGEFLALYAWQPNDARQLAYQHWPSRRLEDHFLAPFEVPDDHLCLFTIYAHGHENEVPFEVAYAIYNGEVIVVPENAVSLQGMTGAIYVVGTTVIFPDGMRKLLK